MGTIPFQTYKQPVKETSRRAIWTHAVETLTYNRGKARIISAPYLRKLYDYACHEGVSVDEKLFKEFLQFACTEYGHRRPEELKVAFFCGPEPENDVDILLGLGVRPENMFAFEYDKSVFKEAVSALRSRYPQVKIYNGRIEKYFQLHQTQFDIIYLDFTNSLTECFPTVCETLDLNALSPLGVLAVNTTYPDPTPENIDFLTDYFFWDNFFEKSIVDGDDTSREYDTISGRVESCGCAGYSRSRFKELITAHFEQVYSAFQTDFINSYANIVKPQYAVMSNSLLRKRLLKENRFVEFLHFDEAFNSLEQQHYWSNQSLFSAKFRYLGQHRMLDIFNEGSDKWPSRNSAMKVCEMLINSHYFKYNTCDLVSSPKHGIDLVERTAYDIPSFLTDELEQSISVVEETLKRVQWEQQFCDVPMAHLWLEMIINDMGYPYHCNVENHQRHRYTAKTRSMCVDVFTFDQCRCFYNWLPMIEYHVDYLQDVHKQTIVRMCLDAIDKHSLWILDSLYFGSAMAAVNEGKWARNHEFKVRSVIS